MLGGLVVGDRSAWAASWGGITPGETTLQQVERRYGRPTRERTVTEEGRAVLEWTYAGERAPQGIERLVVGFGLIRNGRFVADLVRVLTLYPKPGVFRVVSITAGWGKPDALGADEQTGRPALRYDAVGLLVILDRTGEWAELMVLAPERPRSGR